jgi:hypothetical protein
MIAVLRALSRAAVVARLLVAFLCCLAVSGPARAEVGSWLDLDNPDNTVVFGKIHVPHWIAEPLVRASHVAGVNPAYVLAVADKESSLRPFSKARTSSAEGLFQFIEDAWLYLICRYALKHGIAGAAEVVTVEGGRPVLKHPEKRTWLMNLRRDPYISTLMAAEMIKEHRQRLVERTVRSPTETELYLAHFLGLNGAARFVQLLATSPQQSASSAFPSAAKANQSIFYRVEKSRRRIALSVRDVWGRFETMIATRVSRYARLSDIEKSGTAP